MYILTRRWRCLTAALVLAWAAAGCGNESARAPNPPRYAWPDSFAYRLEYAEATQSAAGVVSRLQETGVLRFAVRNDRYLVWSDSLSKVRMQAAGAVGEALNPEDTLHYLVRLGRLGEFDDVVPDCDPTVGACAAAFPSALPMELRRIIPRLPVWWPPEGHVWADTLVFNDLPRPGAARGAVLTEYRVTGDTTLAGRRYWIVGWHSMRQAWRPSGGTMLPDPITHEYGDVLVDQKRLMPVYAQWYGAVPAPASLRSMGVTGTGYRGRAWLAGSGLDSLAVMR